MSRKLSREERLLEKVAMIKSAIGDEGLDELLQHARKEGANRPQAMVEVIINKYAEWFVPSKNEMRDKAFVLSMLKSGIETYIGNENELTR